MTATTWNVTAYLEDLEERLDEAVEDELFADWRRFAAGEWAEPVFQPRRRAATPPKIDWPDIPLNATLDDLDAMVLQQFGTASRQLAAGTGHLLAVRANYGTPIMAMPFGCELFRMPESTHTLPTVHPLPGGAEAMRRVLDRGADLEHPYLQQVYAAGERFREIQRQYPKIGRHVHLYHPDLQGPFDICEMIFGSELFEPLYDAPDLVHQVVDLVTRTYEQVLGRWGEVAPLQHAEGMAVHWHMLHRGTIMLRADSAMNLSPAMFDQFIRPFDQRLLKRFGGGAMHACGRVEHFIDRLPDIPHLHAFNMSQPELNDMETICRHTLDRRLPLLDLREPAARAALQRGRDLHGLVHCW